MSFMEKITIDLMENRKDLHKRRRLLVRMIDLEKKRQIAHLDSEVIGQHGGELLVHYASKSSKQPGLLGFIIQGTNVSKKY